MVSKGDLEKAERFYMDMVHAREELMEVWRRNRQSIIVGLLPTDDLVREAIESAMPGRQEIEPTPEGVRAFTYTLFDAVPWVWGVKEGDRDAVYRLVQKTVEWAGREYPLPEWEWVRLPLDEVHPLRRSMLSPLLRVLDMPWPPARECCK